jgi:feruloyl esterase
MRHRFSIGLFLVADLFVRTTGVFAAGCDVASIQAIAPSTSTITAAVETTSGTIPYCQINGSITTDEALGDVIHYEVALPDSGYWNLRFLFGGNAGLAGSISLDLNSLQNGYAVASTDTGHTGANRDASWALNNTPAVLDFEYRAVHESTVAAEQILTSYYDNPAYHSYFAGCSTGGRQALVEAQDYPDDFDGIAAGDPAIGQNYLAFNWNEQAILSANNYLDSNAITLLNQAVLAQCDGVDGVVDGLIQDPAACSFNPATLACSPGQTTGCLTAAQIAAVNKIYQGPVDTTGASLYPGLSISDPAQSAPSDAGWAQVITGCAQSSCKLPSFTAAEPWTGFPLTPTQWDAQDGFYKYFIANNPNLDTRTMGLSNQAQLNTITSRTANLGGEGMNAALTPFVTSGHKLLMYHGWSDPIFSPYVSVNYYNNVQASLGSNTTDSVRLFMVPGMHHCQGFGPGPNTFDTVSALAGWVEQGVPPDGIVASHHIDDTLTKPIDRTMPLCAYPELASYDNAGPVNNASSWSCPTSNLSKAGERP